MLLYYRKLDWDGTDESRVGLVKEKERELGAIAQPGEHLLCKQEVGGSIPPGSTSPV